MKEIKRTLILFVSFALALSLASCAQGQINEDRLPDASDSYHWDSNDPFDFDMYIDVENNTFEDTKLIPGLGTVLFTVNSAALYDSLDDAGISEESYAVSGKEKFDHYIKIDMTVKNVDVSDLGEEYNTNNFRLMGHVDFWIVQAVWFSLGGQANDQKSAYFHYCLPPAGETMEISLAFGLTDSDLAAFRESDGIWLTYDISALQRLKLEGLI